MNAALATTLRYASGDAIAAGTSGDAEPMQRAALTTPLPFFARLSRYCAERAVERASNQAFVARHTRSTVANPKRRAYVVALLVSRRAERKRRADAIARGPGWASEVASCDAVLAAIDRELARKLGRAQA